MRLLYGDEVIGFEVRSQPGRTQRRLSIHVEPDGHVYVDVPPGAAAAEVLAAVKKRARWISAHLATFRAQRVHATPPEYVSGESLHYLGRRYRLRVSVVPDAHASARMKGGYIEVRVPEQSAAAVRATLVAWYRERAAEVFAHRMDAVAEPLRWLRTVPPFRLQFMTRQWGSCSARGRLTLNPWLVRASREAIDYVLLHELCHLRHHNHSRAFYALLQRHMPQWRGVKTDLDSRSEVLLRV